MYSARMLSIHALPQNDAFQCGGTPPTPPPPHKCSHHVLRVVPSRPQHHPRRRRTFMRRVCESERAARVPQHTKCRVKPHADNLRTFRVVHDDDALQPRAPRTSARHTTQLHIGSLAADCEVEGRALWKYACTFAYVQQHITCYMYR